MSSLERSGTWQFAKKWAESGAPQRVVDIDRVGPFLRDVCTLLGDTVERDRADAYRHGPDCARLFGASVVDAPPVTLNRHEVVEALVGEACDAAQSSALVTIVAAKQALGLTSGRDDTPPPSGPGSPLAESLAMGGPSQGCPCGGALLPSAEPPSQTEVDGARRFCFLLSEDDPLAETDTDGDDDQEDCEADDHDIDLDDQPSAAAHSHQQAGTTQDEQKAANSSPLVEHDHAGAPHVSDWSADQVGEWVATCDSGCLAGYREAFVENCITGRDLQDIANRGLVDCLGILQQMGIDRTGDALDLWRLIGDLVAPCIRSFLSEPQTRSPDSHMSSSSSTSLSAVGKTKRRSDAPTRPDAKKPRLAGGKHPPGAAATGESSNVPKEASPKCARCSVPPVPGHTLCERHRLDQNARQREYDRKKAKSNRRRTRERNESQKHGDLNGTAGAVDRRGALRADRAYSNACAERPRRVAQGRCGPHRTPEGDGTAFGIARYSATCSTPLVVASRDGRGGDGRRHAASVQEESDDVAPPDGQKVQADRPAPITGIISVDKETTMTSLLDAHAIDHATSDARGDVEGSKQMTPTKRKWIDQETVDDEGTETEDEELANGQSGPPSPVEVDYPPVTPQDLLALWPERRRALRDRAAKNGGGNDDDTREDDSAECCWYVQRNVQD